MKETLSHLHPSARPYANEADAHRITRIHSEHWISYPLADLALDRLDHLMNYPTRSRMPCLLLHGDSGMGKTMIIEKFIRAHPAIQDRQVGVRQHRVIAMQMPPAPEERRFYSKLLEAIDAPPMTYERLETKEGVALRLLKRIQPRLLIIDEVHHLLAGSAREQRRALNLLKFLANELRIPIVVVGVNEALNAVQSDPQIASRFEPFFLPRWCEDDAFRRLLGAFAQRLPLKRPSKLTDRTLVRKILQLSDGVTGQVASLLANAASHAITQHHERIDEEMLALAAHPAGPMASRPVEEIVEPG